jgi:plastocyanin
MPELGRPSRGAARVRALAGALALVLLCAAGPGGDPGAVRGRVTLAVEGVRLADAGPVVVYLDPPAGWAAGERPRGLPTVSQRNARFEPTFLAVADGSSVSMPNDDAIYHNVFSYSRPNQFDLGLYPGGDSRSVTFAHPGVVKIYCSIHESMSGTIFVAPSPWFDRVGPDGGFAIAGVPPGSYRLRTWSERLPESARSVTVSPGATLSVELSLGAAPGP